MKAPQESERIVQRLDFESSLNLSAGQLSIQADAKRMHNAMLGQESALDVQQSPHCIL